MPDIHENAEKLVKQQVAKLGKQGSENWLSHGQHFDNSRACPYCDQDISSNDLVRAYQTHFNAAYSDLKAKVSALQDIVVDATSDNIIATLEQSVSLAVAKTDGWRDSVQIRAIHFDAETSRNALAAFREFVVSIVLRKNAAPAEPFGSDTEKSQAIALWEQVLIPLRSTNGEINAITGLISAYKSQLNSDSVPLLRQQLQQFQLSKNRYDAKVVQLLELLSEARKNVEATDKIKKTARDDLDTLMTTTLSKYQVEINALLKNFGASFSIKGMSANFRGNAPRSEYGLSLRERDIPLEGVSPSFSTVLSEGDKRTLAFAFFIASTMQDPKLPNQTVVIDDPMCSLDRNRRHHTQTVLKRIHSQAAQLIVLAHDAYFIRDLRDTLKKNDATARISLFQLAAVQESYTDFARFDIEKECASVYARHHQLLNDFSNGQGNDHSSIAKAIRPMLEGYLHRRFPGTLGKDQLFGQAVSSIRDAPHSSPLHHAKNLVNELNEINSYASQFHHDTNPDADAISVSPAELKTFVKRALDVVHKSAPP
jgi:wobble nucleotide-excising tRNase